MSLNDTPGFGKSGMTRMADRRYCKSLGERGLVLDALRFLEESCKPEAGEGEGHREGEPIPSGA